MRHTERYLIIVLLIFFSSALHAQSCTQKLRLAQTTYEQGRLHELETLLSSCLNAKEGEGGFTKQEKVSAYRYLTLAYIYLEEPEKADQAMLNLLHTDNFFETNPAIDPAEFVALHKKFRTQALFRIGARFGGNATFPNLIENNSVGTGTNGNYAIRPGFSAGLVFEKDFPDFIKNFSIAPEIAFIGRSFSYSNNDLFPDYEGDPAKQTYISKQSWLDLNALCQYRLKEGATFTAYAGFGPGISYLIKASYDQPQTLTSGGGNSGAAIDVKTSYKSLAYSLTALVGAKIKLGGLYLSGDIRYQYGLNNIVNEKTRSNSEALWNYGIVTDDYKLSNVILTLGITKPYFSPKKLYK